MIHGYSRMERSVRRLSKCGIFAVCWIFACAFAQNFPPSPGARPAPEVDFSPPPVPEFMLRRQDKPLSLEEMQKQADEAARRAREDKARQTRPPVPAGGDEGQRNR